MLKPLHPLARSTAPDRFCGAERPLCAAGLVGGPERVAGQVAQKLMPGVILALLHLRDDLPHLAENSRLLSVVHVALEKLEDRIPGFKVKVVPYQKSTDVVLAALGGHVNACFQTQEWAPYVASGQLRLLAAPQKERLSDYPSVPTWLDLGYGVYARSQGAYVAPAGLPENIRDRIPSTLSLLRN